MRKAWLGTAVIAFFAIVIWQLVRLLSFAEPLSAVEAASKVKNMYKGEIAGVVELSSAYRVTMVLDSGTYVVSIEKNNGKIKGMARTKKTALKPEAKPPAVQSDKQKPPTAAKPEPKKRISEKEAIAIALKTVNGKVDDIDLIQSGGIAYYLIEIDQEDGADGTVQINAITGEVKSVTWDD
ncbi:PepSY domain-containing protein [Paenibacillus alvei]|uniref:PepSY domain-containing protein n=1 Tax=Paenibacillus alvei TaxID=44250 RepID=A0ABT4GWG3_PAEAL|nr:PepSY domain-containing protein [Paenibacillus alvei]MCY7484008.1 PepSY domain-containing protein [Paenibacillus alvei]MCY9760903.1 PepSY domain-containing protein [Paenibacillus alvei]MCY9769018.1 PepSY domain-containing protein [Paenibacillus alvei]